jgi:hypothetical protein
MHSGPEGVDLHEYKYKLSSDLSDDRMFLSASTPYTPELQVSEQLAKRIGLSLPALVRSAGESRAFPFWPISRPWRWRNAAKRAAS